MYKKKKKLDEKGFKDRITDFPLKLQASCQVISLN